MARVAWISVAPVKGLGLAEREEVLLEPFGVRENRRFYLTSAEGRLLTGKQLGRLLGVAAAWDEEANRLELRFPDGRVAAGVVELGERVRTSFYGKREVEGRLVLGPWAEALSDLAGSELRLVRAEQPGAAVDRGGAAITLLSTGSLDRLREVAGVEEPIDHRRFRMLFGVEGVEPHEEDTWLGRRVRIGEAAVVVRGNVGRCVVTCRDPNTGARTLPTLDLIAAYRDGAETTEPLPFGVWGEVAEPGRVRRGDPVRPER
jgi:uncharacterized protein YcbX